MFKTVPAWSIHQLEPLDRCYLDALHLACVGRLSNRGDCDSAVRQLLSDAQAGRAQIRPVLAACRSGRPRVAVAGVESGGRSNVLLVPFDLSEEAERTVGETLLQMALECSRSYGVVLSQVIGPAAPSLWDESLREAGMSRLTTLVYLSRTTSSIEQPAIPPGHSEEFSWMRFSTNTEHLFREAIEQSYVQSLDCPELSKLRTPAEALAAHRSVGLFDPNCWLVAMHGDRPKGVLLLAQLRQEPLFEIVYMGVAPEARGGLLANLLMQRAIEVATRNNAGLILAVDQRNVPARRLYERWKFVEVARKSAWIARSYANET